MTSDSLLGVILHACPLHPHGRTLGEPHPTSAAACPEVLAPDVLIPVVSMIAVALGAVVLYRRWRPTLLGLGI